jgi:PST family polysaccharide transporter
VNVLAGFAILRLLGPDAVGTYALATAIVEATTILHALSPALAIVQFRQVDEALQRAANRLTYAISASGTVLAVAVAVTLRRVSWSELASVTLAVGCARALGATLLLPSAVLQRRSRFGALGVVTVIQAVLSSAIALACAAAGIGAMSLATRELTTGVIGVAAFAALARYSLRADRDPPALERLLAFGRPMLWSRAAEIGTSRVDRLGLGLANVAERTVGLYSQARYLAELPFVALSPILATLGFNAYARAQDDPSRLRRIAVRADLLALVTVVPFAAALPFAADILCARLYGSKWSAAGPWLAALSLYCWIVPCFENRKQLLYAVGVVGPVARIRTAQVALLAAAALAECAGFMQASTWPLLLTLGSLGGLAVIEWHAAVVTSVKGSRGAAAPALGAIPVAVSCVLAAAGVPAAVGAGLAAGFWVAGVVFFLFARADDLDLPRQARVPTHSASPVALALPQTEPEGT